VTNVTGTSSDRAIAAIVGTHTTGEAIHAQTQSQDQAAIAAYNLNPTGTGSAVFAKKEGNTGHAGFFVGDVWIGGNLGVTGAAASRPAVLGENTGTGPGITGTSNNEAGVRGTSLHGTGVVGIGGAFAAQFVGTVQVKGDISVSGDVVLSGADYAEGLSTRDINIEAGNVVVIGADGNIRLCDRDYDSSVAGIVSGAGGVRPAIVLDRHEGSADVALIGKVWCRADADAAPIQPGDLLTTSSTPGHCRRVTEPERAFGAIIGKALTPLLSGKGLVRVLVSPR
jgi:hypothetical protein